MALDFIAGCVGGCAGVLVGHPLDTIKVHLQTQDPKNPQYRGVWHCLKTIVAQENVRGLYRGITSPMAGIGMVNAIVFGIYGNIQRHTQDPNSLYSHFLAGSVAGLLQSVVCAPMELVKTRVQLQHITDKGIKHKGPFSCFKYIYRTEGIRATFKGLTITAIRDVPGFSSYFVSYEYMMRLPSNPNALHALLAGGMAGVCSWLSCYPIDVVKTCLQADGMSGKPIYSGAFDCIRKEYRNEGFHFFFRGLSSTIIRAFPMNAACFFVISIIMRMANTTGIDVVLHSAEPLAILDINSIPICHLHQSEEHKDKKVLKFMAKSLTAIGSFDEAVCHTEVEELVNDYCPKSSNYFILKEDLLANEINTDKKQE